MLILDEADQMLDLGFREELEGILDLMPKPRRTHMMSATFPPPVLALARRYQQDSLHVEGTRLGQANVDIKSIQNLMGHESIQQTATYIDTSPDVLKKVVAKII